MLWVAQVRIPLLPPGGVAQTFCPALGPRVSGVYKPNWSKSRPNQGVQDKVAAQETVQDTVHAVPSTEPYRAYRYVQAVPYQIRRSLKTYTWPPWHVPRTPWRRKKLYKIRRSYRTPYRTEPANTYKPYRTRYGEATSGRTPIVIA